MTREEAKHRLLDIERCTPIHTREDVRDFEALEMAIKALEEYETVTEFADRCRECGRKKVLDKIRAEIEKAMDDFYYDEHDLGVRAGFRFALEIIDNHISGKEQE